MTERSDRPLQMLISLFEKNLQGFVLTVPKYFHSAIVPIVLFASDIA